MPLASPQTEGTSCDQGSPHALSQTECTDQCESFSSAPGLNHPFFFLPNTVLSVSLYTYEHLLMERLFVSVARDRGRGVD